MKKLSGLVIGNLALFLPGVLLAVTASPGGQLPTDYQSIFTVISVTIDWLFWILLAGAAIMVIIGAFTFLMAAGDTDKVKKARDFIIYALIAAVVAFLAKAVVGLIGTMLGTGTPLQNLY